jgi:hypothetical protein
VTILYHHRPSEVAWRDWDREIQSPHLWLPLMPQIKHCSCARSLQPLQTAMAQIERALFMLDTLDFAAMKRWWAA